MDDSDAISPAVAEAVGFLAYFVTAQVAVGSGALKVCDQAIRIGVQGLQDIPALLPGC